MYQVSNIGRVRSFNNRASKERILKPYLNKRKGYLYVFLSGKNKKNVRINRLVAEAFIPNIDGLPQVNHLDTNKLNNCVSNLEWCTGSENMKHAYKNGLNAPPRHDKKIAQVNKDTNEIIRTFDSIAEAKKVYNNANICQVLKGRRKTAKGFKWVYVN